MNHQIKAAILVFVQFFLLGILVFTTHNFQVPILTKIFLITSILLAAYAIITMQKSKLRISPIPDANAKLITNGPYKFIRHPMYSSILLGCIGLLIIQFSWLRIFLFVLLIIDLLFKLQWEEKMLCSKFSDYAAYMKKSKRLIPFIF